MTSAESLARRAHAGQADRGGRPVVEHLERVVANLVWSWPDATSTEIGAAWLHHGLRNSTIGISDILRSRVGYQTVSAIHWLTWRSDRDYLSWISTLAEGAPRAVLRVKLADNEDAIGQCDVASDDWSRRMLAERYEPARKVLEEGYARRFGQDAMLAAQVPD